MAWRHFTLVAFFLLAGLGLVARVVYLNVTERQFLIDQGERRSIKSQEIPAHRGVIYDRFGEPLAVSTPVMAVYANLREGELEAADRRALCATLELDCQRLQRRLEQHRGSRFLYLARGVSMDVADELASLDLPGIGFLKEYRRFYPAGESTAHVVGLTDIDDQGIEGIELSFDDQLQGEAGRKVVLKDRSGQVIKELDYADPARFGADLTLSLDLRLQFLAYRELKSAVQSHRAKAGSLVMLDVASGEILALVNQPAFNPNEPVASLEGLRNRAATDIYEPGSTMKPFTILAALKSGRYQRQTMIDTSPFYIGRKRVHDPAERGDITLETALKKSSQTAIARVALDLGERAVFDVLSEAGVGEYLGTGLHGEVVGKLTDDGLERPIAHTTLAYGYGLAITPLQLADAYMMLANGGIRRPVSVLRQAQAPAGYRVFDERLVRQVVEMMEGVTARGGTAPGAHIEGFRVAGKTGTIRKVVAGAYDDGQHAAWFAGMAPATAPRIVTVVLIDEPQGEDFSGGKVAAPVFGRVMARTMHLLGIPPDARPEQEFAGVGV